MWLRCLSWCGVALAAAATVSADMLESARRARAMLGPERWAQVLRIEQARSGLAPARVVHALVFELEDRLWFYEAEQGTQSLSTHRGRLAQDKADLGPLLRTINPAFTRHHVLREAAGDGAVRAGREPLPQGCFIECLAYLRTMTAAGRAPDEARLVAYYGGTGTGTRGHTVLYFSRLGRRYFYDPEGAPSPLPLADDVGPEPLAIARVAAPGSGYAPPARAVFLPLHVPTAGVAWTGPAPAAPGPAGEGAAAPVLMN